MKTALSQLKSVRFTSSVLGWQRAYSRLWHLEVQLHPPDLGSPWEGACPPLHRVLLPGVLGAVSARAACWEPWFGAGLSGIRRDPPYTYYLLAACSLPGTEPYVTASWCSLSRACTNAG